MKNASLVLGFLFASGVAVVIATGSIGLGWAVFFFGAAIVITIESAANSLRK